MSIVGLIALLVIWGVIVGVVTALLRRRAVQSTDDAGSSGRRSFQYFLLLVLLFMTATGVAQLLGYVLPGDDFVAGDRSELAGPLALVVVGLPSYVLLLWWIRQGTVDDAAERASGGWSGYVNGALIISLLVTMGTGIATLSWVFGVADYVALVVSFLLVYGVIWVVHWIYGHRDLPVERTQPHLAIASAAGLLTLAIGGGIALGIALTEIYDQLFATAISADFSESIQVTLAFVIAGALVWWWHWLRRYQRFERTEVWSAYVVLLGVFGGLVVAISSLGVVLFGVLQWLFGDPDASRAAEHFEFLPAATAAVLVGGGVWWYHRAVLRASGEDERSEVDRIYQYLLAALGQVTTIIGLTAVLVALIGAVTPEPLAGSDSEIDVLLAAVSALLIGAPIWWRTWSSIQHQVAADPESELASPTRSLYLLVLVGLGGVVALGSLVSAMVIAFGALLDGTFGGETIYEMRVAIAVLITVGLVAAYHWSVWRSDRETLPEEARPAQRAAVRDVVLLAPDGVDTEAVGPATGANVRVMRRLDAVEVDIEKVIAAISASEADRIIVVPSAGGKVDVIPVGGLRER